MLASVENTDTDKYSASLAQDTFDSSSNATTTFEQHVFFIFRCADVSFRMISFRGSLHNILSPGMKFYFGKKDRNEITPAGSFISGILCYQRLTDT